jgi:HEAT repeats
MPDPIQPSDSADAKIASENIAEPRPSEADVVKALVEVENATTNIEATKSVATQSAPPSPPAPGDVRRESWAVGRGPVAIFIALGIGMALGVSLLLVRGIERGSKELSGLANSGRISSGQGNSRGNARAQTMPAVDAAVQKRAEELLSRVAAGDSAAADQVLAESSDWTGKSRRSPRTDQSITAGMNSSNMHAREAALQAQLALDGVFRDERGFAMMERAVGNAGQRAWALWMLGALGNRGVDPIHTAKIIGSYLTDPSASVRASAVDALSLVGTDETIPMLLDRFRNDPSPVVQERAACAIAESGMYTHEQRMTAASSLVGWLDDSLLTTQQRRWTVQALGDISGKNLGTDSAAWRSWYEGAR